MRVDETYDPTGLVRTLTHHGDGTGTLRELVGGEWVESEVSGLPVVTDTPPVDPIDALRDALAPITPSSNSATVRTALLNLKAALGQ